jgi:hypothetical protein
MKKFFAISVFILFYKLSISQDTIVKIDGDIIQAKITEINPENIRYKKFNYQDGPIYIVSKSDIQFIKYANGLKEEFNAATNNTKPAPEVSNSDYYNPNAVPINPQNKMEPYGQGRYKFNDRRIGEREMQTILMKTKDKEIISLVQSSKDAHKMQFIGFGAIPLGVGALYFLGKSIIVNPGQISSSNLSISAIMFVGAVACPIASGIYKHKRTMCNRRSVKLYNERF